MKRSGSPRLVLMATTAVVLAGCQSEPRVEVNSYKTVDQCIASGEFTESECNEGFSAALEAHEESGPRYNSRQLCEEQHGLSNCEERGGGTSSFFAPFMAGYIVSNIVNSADGSRRYSDWQHRSRPVYRSGQDSAVYTAGGHQLRRNTSTGRFEIAEQSIRTDPKPARVQSRTTVASRGGFGSRSRSSGFGG